MLPLLFATLKLALMIPQQTAPHVPLQTPWSQDALDGKGWLEYPRPQLERSRWLNLNGLWDCAIAPRGSPPPSAYRERIRVPYPVESALSGVTRSVKPGEQVWYRRGFTVPVDWKGGRILLHFGAVNWSSAVWINGALAGAHQGGYDPFTIDITPYLSPGGEQTIVVSASNPANTSGQPRGKQTLEPSGIWYTPSTGIWQTAWIEPVPAEASVAELRVVPDIDAGSVDVTVIGDRPDTPDTVAVRARVETGGQVVAEATYRLDRTLRLKIPRPVLWTPDHPFLYDLRIELFQIPNPFPGKRGFHREEGEAAFFKVPAGIEPLDSLKSYFGLRQIERVPGPAGPVFALNHHPIFMFGPLDQGFWPDGIYTAPTEAAFRSDLDFLKRAGFNGLRKHVKVEPELYYRYCDQIGLLVWQDMPSGMTALDADTGAQEPSPEFVASHAGEAVLASTAAAQFELELRRMIDALAHHPCIVVWVPFNEGWGQHDTARLGAWIKAYDPTRLVDDASGWKDVGSGDIRDIHTYHPHPQMPAEPDPSRITVIGEFGGVALACPGHMWFEKGWGYQQSEDPAQLVKDYRQRVEGVAAGVRTHGIAAAIYTQTTDVEGELNGLMTYDRKVIKIPAAELKAISKPLYQTK